MDAVEYFGRTLAYHSELVHRIGDRWSSPTPNDEWDVRALENHVTSELVWMPPMFDGKTVDDVLSEAQKAKIPVYLIKIGGNIQNKRSVADELWIGAVKKTGGEFFSGGDEATIIRAIQAIDRRAAGKIEMKQYSTERPRYAPFAMIAALLWCAALLLRFTIPTFQTFP